MICIPHRFTSFVVRLAFFLHIAIPAGHAQTTCATTMIDNLGPNAVHAIQDKIEPLAAQYHPNLDRVLPAEVANTAEENLPLFKRYYLLEPVRRGPPVVADVYYGDYTSSSPDVFVLPRNPL